MSRGGEVVERSGVRRSGGSARTCDDRGFALAVVVFLLFAIGVAAAVGYQVVQTEVRLAVYSGDAAKALSIAHAGIQRLLGESSPDLSTSRTYAIDGGEAVVESRRVAVPAFPNEIRLVTSTGSFAEPRLADAPAVRAVRQYVRYRRAPLNVLAAAMSTGPIVESGGSPPPVILGVDRSMAGDCAEAPHDVDAQREFLDPDAADVPWDRLTDPAFEMDHEEEFPSGGPSREPILVRFRGPDLPRGGPARSGILIVTGSLVVDGPFRWSGIILVGDDAIIDHNNFELNGVIMAGLNGGPATLELQRGSIQNDSCEILRAGALLSRVQPLANSWWEVH